MASVRSVLFSLQDRGVLSGQCIMTEIMLGTSSKVFFIDDYDKQYILKLNPPSAVQLEAAFLKRYQHLNVFPNIISTDDTTHILMQLMPGKMIDKSFSKTKILEHLNFMHQYDFSDQRVGYMNDLHDDFKDFLFAELELERLVIDDYYNSDFLFEALQTVSLPEERPMYVHGDFGYHNCLMDETSISIIDPTPMQNIILYELLFLYFSSPEDINEKSFKAFYQYYLNFSFIEYSDFVIYAKIILALRLSTSTRHHPGDTDIYLTLLDDFFDDQYVNI